MLGLHFHFHWSQSFPFLYTLVPFCRDACAQFLTIPGLQNRCALVGKGLCLLSLSHSPSVCLKEKNYGDIAHLLSCSHLIGVSGWSGNKCGFSSPGLASFTGSLVVQT